MTDLKTIGDRLHQIRNKMGLSQKVLAASIGVTQTTISRLENGEDVYASALLGVLVCLRQSVNIDSLLASEFSIDSHCLNFHNEEEARLFIIRHLDILKDTVISSNEACLQQLELMKKTMAL